MTADERKAVKALCDALRPIATTQIFPGGFDLYDPWWCNWRSRAQPALERAEHLLATLEAKERRAVLHRHTRDALRRAGVDPRCPECGQRPDEPYSGHALGCRVAAYNSAVHLWKEAV